MADIDKNILITPSKGTANTPKIEFTGGDASTITLDVLDAGTLSFSGTSGQLFSIDDSMDGTIFSVNDISGIPSIEVDDSGTVRIAEYTGNVLIGTNVDNGVDKLQVNGTISATEFIGDITANDTTLLGGETSAYHLDWANTTNKPDPVITLGGDLTGNVTLTDLGNGTLTATVVDDSHNHVIGNVDGLQAALDAKIDDGQVLTNVPAGAVFTDTVYDDTAIQAVVNAKVDSVVAGSNIVINASDPLNPIISSTSSTTAGVLSRLYATGDEVVLSSGTYYSALQDDAGVVASVEQQVTVDDSSTSYFGQDFVSGPAPADSAYYSGSYSGFISAKCDSSLEDLVFVAELYIADGDGNVIDSGITGNPVGSLGVKVLTTLTTGLVNMQPNIVTTLPLTGSLADTVVVATGNRVRYHMSVEKLGTGGGIFNVSLYSGNLRNSYIDVPISVTSDTVPNTSSVAGAFVSDVLESLDSGLSTKVNSTRVLTDVPAGAVFTDTTYTSGDFNHDALTGFVASEHIDWTVDQGGTNIHTGNYSGQTYVSSDFTHDSLTGVSANDHLDWTVDQGATNVHANNYTHTHTDLETDISAKYAKSGGTITGNVILSKSSPVLSLESSDGTAINQQFKVGSIVTGKITAGSSGSMFIQRFDSSTGALETRVDLTNNGNLSVNGAAPTSDNHLTRRDYVTGLLAGKVDDGQVLTNVPAGALFTDTTYSSSNFSHDALTGFIANEHIDWTTDQGATNIHPGNVGAGSSTFTQDILVSKSDAGIVLQDSSGSPVDQSVRIRQEAVDTNLPGAEGTGIIIEDATGGVQADTTPALIVTGEIYAGNSNPAAANKVWHAGNDGVGSGLDADLLDGLNSSAFLGATANAVTATKINIIPTTFSGTYPLTVNVSGALYSHSTTSYNGTTGELTAPTFVGALTGTATNANTLDGLDSLHFTNINKGLITQDPDLAVDNVILTNHVNSPTSAYYWHITTTFLTTATSTSNRAQTAVQYSGGNQMYVRSTYSGVWTPWAKVWTDAHDGAGSGLDADKLDGISSNGFMQSQTSRVNSQDLNSLIGATKAYRLGSGTLNDPESGDYGTLMNFNNLDTNQQILLTHGGDSAGHDMWLRSDSGSAMNAPWRRVWHDGNDGSGSGLDADTVDGVHASSLLRSDVDDTLTSAIITSTGSRDEGMFGTYDPAKTCHIWSMGTAYRNSSTGATFGNLYGAAYKHTTNTTGGTMAGGHQLVWCSNGVGKSALGDNIWTSGNVTAYSDERVKTNIEVIPDALDKIQTLSGYTYDRTDIECDRQTGVIAQEVLKVLPEAVVLGDTEDDTMSVAYGNMVGLLIEGIKELKETNDTLHARIKALEEA